MSNKFFVLCAFVALAQLGAYAQAAGESTVPVSVIEESTESPIADMALIDADLKTSTEKTPVMASEIVMPMAEATTPEVEKPSEKASQPHTVADFIIHPLIAFKPRQVEDINSLGKQASDGGSTTAAPWPLFTFNAGQSIGSSVSSLAGSVSNWLNDRIQLPGLVDTPVRESSTTTTTTTTTQRPDIVVRVQTKGSTRRPIIRIQNNNRPNRVNNNNLLDSEEIDDDEYDDDEDFQGNRFDEEFDEDDDNLGGEEYDDDQSIEDDEDIEDDDADEEEEIVQRPNHRRRPVQQQHRRQQIQSANNQHRRQQNVNGPRQHQVAPNRRRHPVQQILDSEEEEVEDDDTEEVQDDSFEYYNDQQQSSKRSQQSQPNFIQRGQQSLINQIRQFTRGQTPGEIGSQIRKTQQAQVESGLSAGTGGRQRRPQQATLLVNRNGQTVYVAPELLNLNSVPANTYQFPQQQTVTRMRVPANAFPQPPLSVPIKRKGRPTQYITIPWSQLGISPPDQQIVSITDGIQSQPLILNIPQSAINTMQTSTRKKKRPVMTPDTVPLLADASLMDIFKPPKIPPSRTSTVVAGNNNAPVLIATRPKPAGSKGTPALLPARIRPGTIVEKAPVSADASMQSTESNEQTAAAMSSKPNNNELRKGDNEFILVGEDGEPGVARQVQPVYGDARYISLGDFAPYRDSGVIQRRFALRKSGRALEHEESAVLPVVDIVPETVVETSAKNVPESEAVNSADVPLINAATTEEEPKIASTTNVESQLQSQIKEAIVEAIEKKLETAASSPVPAPASESESTPNPEPSA